MVSAYFAMKFQSSCIPRQLSDPVPVSPWETGARSAICTNPPNRGLFRGRRSVKVSQSDSAKPLKIKELRRLYEPPGVSGAKRFVWRGEFSTLPVNSCRDIENTGPPGKNQPEHAPVSGDRAGGLRGRYGPVNSRPPFRIHRPPSEFAAVDRRAGGAYGRATDSGMHRLSAGALIPQISVLTFRVRPPKFIVLSGCSSGANQ